MQVCKLIPGVAGLLLAAGLYAQTVTKPKMPAMPEMPGMPALGGPFYTPTFPTSPVAPKKKDSETVKSENETETVITNTNDTEK